MTCASCSAPLAADARFCQRCGAAAPEAITPAADPIRETLKVALGRQYEVLGLLGRGGMGAVYLATEAALEREVAIKVLPPDRGATKDSRDRFRREARTAARLSHPNIVPLYTFGDVDGTLYFVMGYVKGESLAARLKREGRLPVEESRRILIEIAEALEYAHKLGVIHRDIKPDNVLLEEGTGRALLTDFGVAKALGAGQTMTEVGSVLGTPQYMSPEQAQGKSDIDHRSDLYSLGVMGYAMLAGRLPFDGPTAGDIMAQHITKEAPALLSLAAEIPVEIATALTRCLVKDRDKRWPDAAALRQAITIKADDDQPPQLDGLGVFFIAPTLSALVLLCFAAWWLGGGDVSDKFPILFSLVCTAGAVPFLLLPWRWLHLRRLGFTGPTILREIFRPVQKWPGWHPAALRQRGDVWDRLPPELRQFRSAIGCIFLSMAVLIPCAVFDLAFEDHVRRTGRPPGGLHSNTVLGAALSLALLAAVSTISLGARFELFRRRRGVDPYIGSRLIETPTFKRSFWAKPEIAALLLPENRGGGIVEASTGASDMVVRVAAAVAAIDEPGRALADRAHACATGLAQKVAVLDRQIAQLERAFDPLELKRMVAKLAALGQDDVDREARDMAARQRDVMVEIQGRLRAATSLKLSELDLLRSLLEETSALASTSGGGWRPAADRLERLLTRIDERVHPIGQTTAADVVDAPTLER